MRFVIVAGNTDTARIEGISAAGTDPEVMAHTPNADLEVVEYGRLVSAPVLPMSPTGCPTPAVMTRAVRECCGFETLALDVGLAKPPSVPTIDVGDGTGADIREAVAVESASGIFEAARTLARGLPDDELAIGETIPGGTTTAHGVLTALGEPAGVSSSLPENPMPLKREVVEAGLDESDLVPGGTAGDSVEAVRRMGDPVLAGVAGLVVGANESGTDVLLAGGTQLVAAAALARHAGIDDRLALATTPFVAADESIAIGDLSAALDLDLTITDPAFEELDHPATNAYVAGEAKEGVGMGGALALADRTGIPMADVREAVVGIYDRLYTNGPVAES
jgi:uncharacterized protein (TIGR00303 family)